MKNKKHKVIMNAEELELVICAVSALYDDLNTRTCLPGECELMVDTRLALDSIEDKLRLVLIQSEE